MKPIIVTGFLILLSLNLMSQEKIKLLYFADPMCSWCYGFSPELTKVIDQLGDSIELQLVMGGLRPYNKETMADLADFLKDHWKHVHDASDQPFDYGILKDNTIAYDTEPACRAVVVMRQLDAAQEYDFFKAIQTAFYLNNKDPNKTETYVELAEEFGLDPEAFRTAFESQNMKDAVKEDFIYSGNVGVRGFPTLVLQKDRDLYLLTNGYAKAALILEKINNVLSAEK